jgi:hypothetical protein
MHMTSEVSKLVREFMETVDIHFLDGRTVFCVCVFRRICTDCKPSHI